MSEKLGLDLIFFSDSQCLSFKFISLPVIAYKLLKGKIGKTYNIGSENEISNIDLAKKICTLLDEIKPKKNSYKKQLAFVKDRLGHDYRYAINSNLIKKELAWKPKIKFNDGLKKTIKWYLKNHSYLKYK